MPEFAWHTVQGGVKMAQKSDFAGRNILLCETRPPTRGLYSARMPRGHIRSPKPSGARW